MLDLSVDQIQAIGADNALKNTITVANGGTDAALALFATEQDNSIVRLELKPGSYSTGTRVRSTGLINQLGTEILTLRALPVSTTGNTPKPGLFRAIVPLVVLYN